jgi:hypothetical protein
MRIEVSKLTTHLLASERERTDANERRLQPK